MLYVCFFFFFQAEDGIRDPLVTGVQTCALPISASWEQMLGPYLGDRWRLAGLTINYRAPAEIMAVATDVLAAIDPELELPRSVRESGTAPWRLQAAPGEFADTVAATAARAAVLAGDGRLAVIVPAARLGDLSGAVAGALPADGQPADGRPAGAAAGSGAGSGPAGSADPDLGKPVVVLTVRQAKGLE